MKRAKNTVKHFLPMEEVSDSLSLMKSPILCNVGVGGGEVYSGQ